MRSVPEYSDISSETRLGCYRFRVSFIRAFLDGGADAFLGDDFRRPAAWAERARAAAGRAVDRGMLAALDALEPELPPSAARRAHRRALADGAAVVVTGQQVGLFLGPLYTVYKAASAVAWARAIERASGVRCVPLFWLQTEDHDFAEVRSCRVLAGDGHLVDLALDADPARVSLAHRRLGAEVDALHDRLAGAFAAEPRAGELLGLLRAEWRAGRRVADAFAATLAHLFADEGLLILDPRVEPVARAAAPLYRRALVEAEAIAGDLRARGEALRAAGFAEQVPVREASLLFHHRDGATGERFRAGAADPELLALLEGDPLRFSTSALLRPIVQDALLPTVAAVGGPAELAYFAQIGPLYRRFGVAQPMAIPRARLRFVDEKARRRLGRLGLAAADLAEPRERLLARLAARAPGEPAPEEVRARLAGGACSELEQLRSTMDQVDPALADALRRTRATIERAAERLAARWGRALAARDRDTAERVDRLQRALFPDGAPQERRLALPSFACRTGARAFVERVLAAIDGQDGPPAVEERDFA